MEEPAPAELLEALESRHDMCLELEKILANDDPSASIGDADLQRDLENAKQVVETQSKEFAAVISKGPSDPHEAGSFADIKRLIGHLDCFIESEDEYKGTAGCLARAEHLFQPLQAFVKKVRVAEGILWGT